VLVAIGKRELRGGLGVEALEGAGEGSGERAAGVQVPTGTTQEACAPIPPAEQLHRLHRRHAQGESVIEIEGASVGEHRGHG